MVFLNSKVQILCLTCALGRDDLQTYHEGTGHVKETRIVASVAFYVWSLASEILACCYCLWIFMLWSCFLV